MSKTLVAYFSPTGTTARAARNLARLLGADVYEIRPAEPYTGADLNWTNKHSRSTLEMQDASSRPQLADHEADIAAYDRAFLGFPIWWGTAPRIVNSFLEAYDFSGKTIVPFATSGGSGFGRTVATLTPSCHGAMIKPGRLLNGEIAESELVKWAEQS